MRVLYWFALLCAAVGSSSIAAAPLIERGELQGAPFALMRPTHWNRGILLIAHGYRPESAPLVADLFPEHAAYKTLCDEGWVIAKTGYRRNGTVIADAIADLDNLRAEVIRRFGQPLKVIVEGDSMGGLIAVLIAERPIEDPPLYHGVVAVGPALSLREGSLDGPSLNMLSQIPVVFLCNRTEIEAPRSYAQLSLPRGTHRETPFLLRINRDGHVNVNQAERLLAIRLLNTWIDHGPSSLPKPAEDATTVDATQAPTPQPSHVFLDQDRRGFIAHVTEVSSIFGNILLDAQPDDFAAVGLGLNSHFQATIGEQTFRVLFGRDFNSAKHGNWVSMENADGFFWLARNNASAAAVSHAQVGDLVHIRKYEQTSSDQEEAEK